MYGIISLKDTGPVARCGFKYVCFEPQLILHPSSNSVGYRGQQHEYHDNKIFFEVKDDYIIRESMTRCVINRCKFLSRQIRTKDEDGKRVVVVNKDYKPYPITTKDRIGGHKISYCPSDAIIFKSNGQVVYNELSDIDPNPLMLDEQLYEYLHDLTVEWPYDPLNQIHTNNEHLIRFDNKYRHLFKSHDVELNKFSNMDVIDLNHIDEIRIDRPDLLKHYPIFEIHHNRVEQRGFGLNEAHFDSSRKVHNKYLFMLITNCDQHRIQYNVTDRTKMLVIHTTIPMSESLKWKKELLWIKFDKQSLLKYQRAFIINSL